ncbi:RagB/SusD family nutrient uptake outer membrane protein [Prevotella sp. P6B4]|uniref:RagB/SusD family nutrient uptake outer membrane protein n=1 Tax=Prevotella sp. P6B4 TaxID=1410614 RepID=UPI0009DDF6C1|nr:RagB/SusD family nutrient uptake outer membrane protein [Prevotella sp. P6B4]
MNKISIKSISIALLSAFVLTACGDEFLDKNPKLDVTEADIFASEKLIDATMAGVYTRFKTSNFAGGNIAVIFDNRGDDFVNTGNNTYAHSDTYNMTVGQTSIMNPGFFQAGYLAINAANTLKENLENRDNLPISEAKRQQYIASCLFIRDISWYYLAQVYSLPYAYDPNSKAIPIHTEAVTGPGHNEAPLWTISEVYEQIINDLNASAIAALPAGGGSSIDPTIPSQAAAHMLLQRIYMAKEEWQKAIDEGEKVTGFTLSNSVRDMFDAPYHTSENIYSLPFTNTERGGGNPASYISSGAGYIDTLNVRTGIVTIPAYRLAADSRTSFIKVDPANGRETWYEKYDEYSTPLEWIHIFRYAETLLNLSESYFNIGNEAKAAELLHQVRSRSIPTGDILDVQSLTGEELRQAIYLERRAEFIGEGIRGLDISRRAEDFIHPAATRTNGKWDTVVVATPSNRTAYCWSLPSYEILVNTAAK